VLREGVYLLPDTPAGRQGLSALADYVSRISGASHLLGVSAIDPAQEVYFRGLFDRSRKYEELIRAVEGLRSAFGISEPGAIARVLNKQRREFDAISALDFFPSPQRERAAQALRETEAQVHGLMFPDQPSGAGESKPEGSYLRRIWATRTPLWADRLGSAWLIRRFIDPEATMIWLDKNDPCPHNAVGFGFDGAPFSNSKTKVTFEELLGKFGLDRNPTLVRLGALVHFLDAGGAPVAEAAGVETLLQGARRRSSNEDQLFAETEKTFDLLYEAYYESKYARSPQGGFP
jgi:hypothetical protein